MAWHTEVKQVFPKTEEDDGEGGVKTVSKRYVIRKLYVQCRNTTVRITLNRRRFVLNQWCPPPTPNMFTLRLQKDAPPQGHWKRLDALETETALEGWLARNGVPDAARAVNALLTDSPTKE